MPLEITLECSECGDELEAEFNYNHSLGFRIEVKPCETCLKDARDEVYADLEERRELED